MAPLKLSVGALNRIDGVLQSLDHDEVGNRQSATPLTNRQPFNLNGTNNYYRPSVFRCTLASTAVNPPPMPIAPLSWQCSEKRSLRNSLMEFWTTPTTFFLSDARWIGGIGRMHMVQSFTHNIIECRRTPILQNNPPLPPPRVPRMSVGTFHRITTILHTTSPPPSQRSPYTIS